VATKYKRDGEAPAPSRKDMNPVRIGRRWFLFAALIAVCILSVLRGSVIAPGFDNQPELRGEGIIYDKLIDSDDNEPRYLLQVGVSLDNGHVAIDYVRTEPETWHSLAKGDRIGVLYQRGRTGDSIRIREAGLVALPPANQ